MNILISIPRGPIFDMFLYPKTLERLKKMGNVELNEMQRHFTHEELCKKIRGVDMIITGWVSPRLDPEVMANADSLKFLVHTGGSVAPFVCEEVYKRGVKVLSGNELYAESVAEGVIAYMLTSLRQIPKFSADLAKGKWNNLDLGENMSRGLLDSTVGIVSYGTISKYLVPMLQPFRVKIKLYSRKKLLQELLEKYNIEQVSLEEVFSKSDIITVQTSLNKHTVGMIDKRLLSLIKDGALFINTARGPIVCEADLVEEIKKNRFSVVLDVFDREPLPQDSPLLGHPNVMLMPHMAGPTMDRRGMVVDQLLDDVENYLAGGKLTYEVPWEKAQEMTR